MTEPTWGPGFFERTIIRATRLRSFELIAEVVGIQPQSARPTATQF